MTETREAYVQKLKAKIDEWNAEIDKLAAKAEQVDADSKIEYQKQIDGLQAKRDELERKISDIREAGEGAWEDMKAGVESAWEALDEAFKSMSERFKSS